MEDRQPTLGNGKICYIEIPSTDIHKSSTFYHKTFGWNITFDGEGKKSFEDGVGEVSGRWVEDRAPMEAGVLVHIMVDDMEQAIKMVENHGGKIVQPLTNDQNQITAIFKDPCGNIFGLYQHNSLAK